MRYADPGQPGSKVEFKKRYQNFIGGKWREPVKGEYFENVSPVTGRPFCEVPRSNAEDVNRALDAAHAAKDAWGKTSYAQRSVMLNKIADRMEQNLELLAVAETWDNGKPIRETLAADLPLAIDHFRYFAGCARSQEGQISQLDENTIAYHLKEPLAAWPVHPGEQLLPEVAVLTVVVATEVQLVASAGVPVGGLRPH